MNKAMTNIKWLVFGGLCTIIGLYPLVYFLVDGPFGLLETKTQELLLNQAWNIAFYGHITLGGIALLVGWVQFSAKLRAKNMALHRAVGKVYMLAILVSGICGLFVAQSATGGIGNVIGFSLSGIIWLATTFLALQAIKQGRVAAHENYMIYSYAVCFSAVTLRIWLPLLIATMGSFSAAYGIVSWLSWLPNLLVAYYIVRRRGGALSGVV